MPTMTSIVYRKSTESDYNSLKALFYCCFGGIAENGGALSWIDNRYILCVIDDKIVACTGILPLEKSDYNGYEITWTCTHPDYRHNGHIVDMLKICEDELNDNLPIYCDCWHLADREYANLHNALTQRGFRKIIDARVRRVHPHNLECIDCLYKKKNCKCSGDLYQKARKEKV